MTSFNCISNPYLVMDEAELLQRYRDGERNFENIDICDRILGWAYLVDASFQQSRLCWTILEGANLRRVCFQSADLSNICLTAADLVSANLRSANLYRADLRGADLSCADFTGANLSSADFTGADLTGAILTGANVTGTIFPQGYAQKSLPRIEPRPHSA